MLKSFLIAGLTALCLAAQMLLLAPSASAQPQPGDVFREYVWLPNMVAESGEFLRVGGRLDYQTTPDHFPPDEHDEGHIPFGHAFDLEDAVRAELLLERVQSHEDTKGLAVQINGHDWIAVPPPADIPRPASDYMYHDYPVVPVPLASLNAGSGNTFKMRVDPEQRWDWPQNLFYAVTLRVYYGTDKRRLEADISGIGPGDALKLEQQMALRTPDPAAVERVDFVGRYRDFSWRGDGIYDRWQYSYHRGQIRNHLGTATEAPFRIEWETEWVPDQQSEILVAARVTYDDGLIYFTPAVPDLRIDRAHSVELALPYRQPVNWVTRADSFTAYVGVHGDVRNAEAMQLLWRSWSSCYARGVYVNGVQIYDRGADCYDYDEHRVTVENPQFLRAGENTISTGKTPLIHGEMVHGMEVQWPGILMKVKYERPATEAIRITEGSYAGRPHFIIDTPGAVYYYDRAGGGLSRLIDVQGRDWIGFWPEPWNEYPASAASAYRGIPNLVFGSDDGGAGHPGHDQCRSERVGDHAIRSVSTSGHWQWTWQFYADHARMDVEKVDPDHPYWFLYEGTPGGRFDPSHQYFGTEEEGPVVEVPDYLEGERRVGTWRWAYFGHDNVDRILFVAQQPPDDHVGYLGNTDAGLAAPDGMVVFGFGRKKGAVPLMTEPRSFFVGLQEEAVQGEAAHRRLADRITKVLERAQR